MNAIVAAAGWAEAGADELFPPELGIGLCIVAVIYAVICPLYWCFTRKPSLWAFFLTALPLLVVFLPIVSGIVVNLVFH